MPRLVRGSILARIRADRSGPPIRCRHLPGRPTSRVHIGPAAVAAALALLAAPMALAAAAHPWCMIYQDMTGATACYFDSYEQCRLSAAGGNGGICLQNPAYRAPARPEPPATRKARGAR